MPLRPCKLPSLFDFFLIQFVFIYLGHLQSEVSLGPSKKPRAWPQERSLLTGQNLKQGQAHVGGPSSRWTDACKYINDTEQSKLELSGSKVTAQLWGQQYLRMNKERRREEMPVPSFHSSQLSLTRCASCQSNDGFLPFIAGSEPPAEGSDRPGVLLDRNLHCGECLTYLPAAHIEVKIRNNRLHLNFEKWPNTGGGTLQEPFLFRGALSMWWHTKYL